MTGPESSLTLTVRPFLLTFGLQRSVMQGLTTLNRSAIRYLKRSPGAFVTSLITDGVRHFAHHRRSPRAFVTSIIIDVRPGAFVTSLIINVRPFGFEDARQFTATSAITFGHSTPTTFVLLGQIARPLDLTDVRLRAFVASPNIDAKQSAVRLILRIRSAQHSLSLTFGQPASTVRLSVAYSVHHSSSSVAYVRPRTTRHSMSTSVRTSLDHPFQRAFKNRSSIHVKERPNVARRSISTSVTKPLVNSHQRAFKNERSDTARQSMFSSVQEVARSASNLFDLLVSTT
ncbi:hypothetical protein LR48_Vigan04g236600 [Vigna angularis]|uniref:Uncharacterized protein n=1 Tax=Phaseolus angularis TaxID=3914 RepID=A0A0L9UHC9_PHAAN|nr:hypothetical protein LR48_Vigan04g236600 [Vigna angularis]